MSEGGLWYEVAAVSKKGDAEVRDIEGNNVLIRGNLGDMLVIQVPKGVNHQVILQGIQRMLDRENIERGVFVIDKDIEMMKLVPVDREKAKVLERKHKASRAARAAASKQNAPTTRTPQ